MGDRGFDRDGYLLSCCQAAFPGECGCACHIHVDRRPLSGQERADLRRATSTPGVGVVVPLSDENRSSDETEGRE